MSKNRLMTKSYFDGQCSHSALCIRLTHRIIDVSYYQKVFKLKSNIIIL